ncbi:Transcriptional regulator (modular protein) [[Clostridium] ultunense Esp]|nr:Transcriptional regulator (modular protein) [[Clostridium] ultunense Esp]
MERNHGLDLQLVLNGFRAISAANKQDLESAATRLGLDSSIQLNILFILYCNDGVRITTIAEWTFWHTSSIVIHVRKLMEKGLVTIEKSEQDGRVVNVFITDEGRELVVRYYQQDLHSFQLAKALTSLENRYSPAVLALFKELLDFIAVEVQGEEKLSWLKRTDNPFLSLGGQLGVEEEDRSPQKGEPQEGVGTAS